MLEIQAEIVQMTGNMDWKDSSEYIMVGKMGQDIVYALFPCYQTWDW